MLFFSASYSKTNHNFIIANLHGAPLTTELTPSICVLKNLIQRGAPTPASLFLKSHLPDINTTRWTPLIDIEPCHWEKTIKGNEEKTYNPAEQFLLNLLPIWIPNYPFLNRLIRPEVLISDITGEETKEFINQQVDFYLPQARLVIEIDGSQHHIEDKQKYLDKKRDAYLNRFKIQTIRIPVVDLEPQSTNRQKLIADISTRLNAYSGILNDYAVVWQQVISGTVPESVINQSWRPAAVARFQIVLISLIEHGALSVDQPRWNINILERDVHQFCDLASDDLWAWFSSLCNLRSINIIRPEISFSTFTLEQYSDFIASDGIKIDFSLCRRWDESIDAHSDVIHVRNDYFDFTGNDEPDDTSYTHNYFYVSTAPAITYDIDPDNQQDVDTLTFLLENMFGYDTFQPGQIPIICSALNRKPTLGLLPTGAGKSLCYWMACLLQPSINFVVCPILSLMEDQADEFKNSGIYYVGKLGSNDSPEVKSWIQNRFAHSKYFCLLIAPERFQSSQFRKHIAALVNNSVHFGYAVIDEAHCLSEWGHDFRLSYLNLASTIQHHCPGAVFLALTATASLNVMKDITIEFNISDNGIKTTNLFRRDNLHFKVIDSGEQKFQSLCTSLESLNTITEQKPSPSYLDSPSTNDNQKRKPLPITKICGENTRCGIIFTPHVNGDYGCFKVTNELIKTYQVDSKIAWFAGKSPKVKKSSKQPPQNLMAEQDFQVYKRRTQTAFKNNKLSLMVATKSFGMGINKPNIHYTIHFGIPPSMEALYQEAGRSGRENRIGHTFQAQCQILFTDEISASKAELDKIFDRGTTYEEITELIEKKQQTRDDQDVYRQLYFWKEDQDTNTNEISRIVKIYKSLFKI